MAVGIVEAALIVGYAVSIVVFDIGNPTTGVSGSTDVGWPVLVALLMIFAVLVAAVTWGVWKRRSAARTPYFLVQAFTVVGAWQLASSDTPWVRIVGVATMAIAVAAVYVMLSGSGGAQLDH